MLYVFLGLLVALLLFRWYRSYEQYAQTQRHLQDFCKRWGLAMPSTFSWRNAVIPSFQEGCWQLSWRKEGGKRTFHHILKLYWDFSVYVPDFELVTKRLVPSEVTAGWRVVGAHLYTNVSFPLPEAFLRKVCTIQSEYGWGALEVKNQRAFYTIPAEPSQAQAWKHLQAVMSLLQQLPQEF